MTKQTGPRRTVKGLGPVAVALVLPLALAACSHDGWTHPRKTAAEQSADQDACEKMAEEDALMRAGVPRADEGPLPGSPTQQAIGPSPMQMYDRDRTKRDFHNSFDDCMESKGYRRGNASSN